MLYRRCLEYLGENLRTLSNEHLGKAVTRVRRYFIRISASLIPEVERGRIPQVVLPDCLQSFVHN